MFFDNFNAICKAKHTTPTAVVKLLGLSSSKVTAWKNGSLPKEDVIQMLADKLEVDTAAFFDDARICAQKTDNIFLERLLSLIQTKGITKNKLLTDLGLGKNSFVNWENRGTVPSAVTVQKIADYLSVDVGYLLGTSDNPAHTQDTNSVDEEVVVYCRNGKTIRKKLTKEQMDYLDKFINSFSEEDYPDL